MKQNNHHKLPVHTLLITAFTLCFAALSSAEIQLVSIPHPDLRGLERVVVDQLLKGKLDVEAIAENPESSNKLKAISYGELGHLYHAYDFLDAAAAAYYNAAQLQSDVYRWNYCVAFIAQQQGDYQKALTYYNKARNQEVTSELDYLVNIRIGECHKNLNKLKSAEDAYKIARSINPEGPTIHARLGELYLAQKEYTKAVNHLRLALTLNPEANKLHYPLAMAYRKLGEKDMAMHHLSQRGIVGIQPPDPLKKKLESLLRGYRVHILEGKSAFAAKRYSEAALSFTKAINEDPNQAAAWINLAAANSQLGRQEEAMASLEHALKIEPDNGTAHFNIGSLYFSSGDYKKAIEHLSKFLEVNGEEASAAAKLAKAYQKNNQYSKSVDMYKNSLRLDHTQITTWLDFITMLERISEFEAALHTAALAFEKLPQDKNILAKLVYMLAASPDKELRNGSKAVELSLRLYQMESNYQTARLVAMSYAQVDDCTQAMTWMEESISIAKKSSQSDTIIQGLQRNREYFSSSVPCRIP